jgi:creatinine deaminase
VSVRASPAEQDRRFMKLAYEQALASYREGGLPIGAVMVEDGTVVAAGHNRRVQEGDPTAHGEMDCFRPGTTASRCTPRSARA